MWKRTETHYSFLILEMGVKYTFILDSIIHLDCNTNFCCSTWFVALHDL